MKRWSTSGVCSQQVIKGGQACKSSVAPMSKSGPHLSYPQAPFYLPGNGHCSPHNSGIVERRRHKNHCRARDVVARNFEEIDQILGESNLIMEQSPSSDIQHKVSEYTKVGKEIRQASIESGSELRQGPHGAGVEHSKQDMEAREVAAIKAANEYLNKGTGHFNILRSERLLEISKARADEELVTTCRRSLDASDGSVDSVDQACYPSTFNTNKQQEWQTTMSLPLTTLKSCNGTKICDKSMSTTSSVTPTTLSESKWLKAVDDNRQWLNNSRQLDSEKRDLSSTVASKGTRKYAEEFNFDESHLGNTNSLDLDGGFPTSSRNCRISATIQRPNTVDTQQYPFPTKKILTKKSLRSRDMSSIPVSHAASFGQEVGVHNPDVPVSESQSCTGREASHGSACLEDGMRQLSTEDLLLALENSRKVRASLRSLSSKDQFDATCDGQRTYRPEQYLSPEKCSMSPAATEFESSFPGDLDGNDEESAADLAILASTEQDREEAFDRTSSIAPGPHRYLLKSNIFQRSKVRHFELSTQLQCSSPKCRGTKDKDKPANLIKGAVVVEELEELALRHNRPKDSILAAAVNSNFKERGQEDFDYRAETASIPNDNCVFGLSNRRQAGNHFPAHIYAKTVETRKADALVSTWNANGAAQIPETSTLSGQAGRQVEPYFAHCSDSYPNQRIHGNNGLSYGRSLPRVFTVRENYPVTSCSVAQNDSRFDNLPTKSTFWSGLDCLISEVVHEWVEICSAPSPTSSACYGSQETRVVSPVTTCSITEEGGAECHGAEDGSSPEKKLKIANGMQASETGNWSANQDLFRKAQGPKYLPRDSEFVKVVRKNSVAALASVVQPLLAALQEAEIEEPIVKEFEADETVRLLLEKLQFYEAKIRALKNRQKGKFKNQSSAEN